jgi:O-antigen/teichoic acid export membrane protein
MGYWLVHVKLAKITLNFNFMFWKNIIRKSLPLALGTIFILFYFRVDIILLSLLKGVGANAEIGWYSAGVKLVDTIGVIPFLVMGGLFPIFSDLYKNNIDKLKQLYQKVFKYMLVFGIGITFGGFILSYQISNLFFGIQYVSNTGFVLKILILNVSLICADFVLLNVLTAIEKQKIVAFCTGICVPVNIILNLVMIPYLGYIGCAIAIVITEMVLFLTTFHYLSKHLVKVNLAGIVAKPVIAGLIMSLILLVLISKINVIILIFIGAIVYLTTLYLMKTFTSEEYNIIKPE